MYRVHAVDRAGEYSNPTGRHRTLMHAAVFERCAIAQNESGKIARQSQLIEIYDFEFRRSPNEAATCAKRINKHLTSSMR